MMLVLGQGCSTSYGCTFSGSDKTARQLKHVNYRNTCLLMQLLKFDTAWKVSMAFIRTHDVPVVHHAGISAQLHRETHCRQSVSKRADTA